MVVFFLHTVTVENLLQVICYSSCNAYVFIKFLLLLLLQYSPNIALEAYVIKAAGFTGMTCTVFQKVATSDRTGLSDYGRRDPDGNLDKQLSFKCNVSNTLSSLALKVGYSLFIPLLSL